MGADPRITAIGAAFLAGTAAVAYGQDGMTQNPGPSAPGICRLTGSALIAFRPRPAATAHRGRRRHRGRQLDWHEFLGVDRRQTGGYPGYGPGYSGSTVAPGGNGALGAGDAAIGGSDRRKPGYRSPVIGRLLLRARSQVSGGSAQRQRRAWLRPSAKTCSL